MKRTFVLAVVLAVACARPPDDEHEGPSPDAGTPWLVLAPAGNTSVQARVGDIISLRAVLSDPLGATNDDGTLGPSPVVGHTVRWVFDVLPASANIYNSTDTTDASGLVESTLTLGPDLEGEIRLHAESEGATSTAQWTITVTRTQYLIRIVEHSPEVVYGDAAVPNVADVTEAVGSTLELQVQVLADNGAGEFPASNETVEWAFVTSVAGANFPDNPSRWVVTSPAGVASINISVGTVAGSYKVLAKILENQTATFQVTTTGP